MIQQLQCYYNYKYTIKKHNNQALTEGSYPFGSIKHALIQLNSKLGEDVCDINMMLSLDIINMISQYCTLSIIDSQLHTKMMIKHMGKVLNLIQILTINVNIDEHRNKCYQ